MGRRAARIDEARFVLEGPILLGEALDAGLVIEEVVFGPGADHAVVDRARAAGAQVMEAEPGVIERASDTMSPQPLLSVTRLVDVPLEALSHATFVVVCVEVGDPGNLGTILRSARAAGADGVVCSANSVDLHSPKVVRSAAGSMFHIPVVVGGNPVEVLDKLGDWGMQRLAADVAGGVDPASADLARPIALVIGNEAHGLPDLGEHVDGSLTIPMADGVESLNVAMAATLLAFEVSRQRRERRHA